MTNKNPKTENLIPLNQLTMVEQRKIQSTGGKKSAKARQEKRLMKDILQILLSMEVTQDKTIKSTKEAMLCSIIKKAIKGDLKAVEWIQACIGEKPIEKTMSLSPTLEAKTEAQQIVADIIAKQIS